MSYRRDAEAFLSRNGIDPIILTAYDDEKRYYHNWNHINSMIGLAKDKGILNDNLYLAILFHDIVYDPKSNDNELMSAYKFGYYKKNDSIKNAIYETKSHKPTTTLSEQLCELDLHNLYGDFPTFYESAMNVFREYQFVDYKIYKEKRIEILKDFNVNPIYIQAIEAFKPNIGVYAGSFNPFHKGHYNILSKAEKIFDKVVIARGENPDKVDVFKSVLPRSIQNRQIDDFTGLLSTYVNNLGYDVTIIRGLRNSTDLQHEMTQYQYLKDFKPDIKVVSIFCDKEFEHISSSSIRLLSKFDEGYRYTL